MFDEFVGLQQAALFPDEGTRRGFAGYLERVYGFYGENGGVDIEVMAGQLALTAETREYLYEGDFTPRGLPYVPGSRPLLEEVVGQAVRVGMSAQETALALLRRCRDNRQHGLPGLLWYGGSEEELLKRGAIMCNEISRVFVCLCQIAGLRARLMCSHITGHMMAEVEVDGRWWWTDPRHGLCCWRDDGAPASAWDLWQDPTLFDRQPSERLSEARSLRPFFEGDTEYVRELNLTLLLAMSRDCCFHPKEAVALGNYFVWECDRYTFPWFDRPADPARLLRARLTEMQIRKELGWPEWYGNPYLFRAR